MSYIKKFTGPIKIKESAVPSTPEADFGTIYFGTDGILYSKNDSGTVAAAGTSFPLLASDGSALAPSYSFNGTIKRTASGMYFDTAVVDANGNISFAVYDNNAYATGVPAIKITAPGAAPRLTFAGYDGVFTGSCFIEQPQFPAASARMNIFAPSQVTVFIGSSLSATTANTTFSTNALVTHYGSMSFDDAGISRINNILWNQDGNGSIGSSGANRPDKIFVRTSIRNANGSQPLPSYTFDSAPSFGLAYDGDFLFCRDGAAKMYLSSTALEMRTPINMQSTHVIKNSAGVTGTPSYTFDADPDTGMFSDVADSLKFTSGGALRLTLNSTASTFTGRILGQGTQSAAPDFSFANDLDTGISGGGDELDFVTGGLYRAYFTTTHFQMQVPIIMGTTNVIRNSPGTVSLPSYTFRDNLDTGMYTDLAGTLKFATGGNNSLILNSTTATFIGRTLIAASADGANPGYSFNGDSDTGISGAGDELLFHTAGVFRGYFTTTNLEMRVPIRMQTGRSILADTGSVSTPAYSFRDDLNTGFYNDSSDDKIKITLGGVIGSQIEISGGSGTKLSLSNGSALSGFIQNSAAGSLTISAPGPTVSLSAASTTVLSISNGGATRSINMDGTFHLAERDHTLLANLEVLSVGTASFIRLSSDDITAANRTFTLGAHNSDGQILVIVWNDAVNSARILNAGVHKLNGDWVVTGLNKFSTLTLICSAGNWCEIGRYIRV